MSDKKISELIASTTPLAGTEVLPIVQSGVTKKVSIANLTAGRSLSADTFTATSTDTSGAVIQVNTSATTQGRIGGSTSMIYLANTQHIFFNGATEVGRFNSSNNLALATGNLVIGTSGKGIDFSADGSAAGMTSELLDDYEEGTFTSSMTPSTSGTIGGAIAGTYTKVGNKVTVTGEGYVGAAGVSSPVGYVKIDLPFTVGTTGGGSGKRGCFAVEADNVVSANAADFVGTILEGESFLRVYLGNATTLANSAEQFKAYTTMKFTATYFV